MGTEPALNLHVTVTIHYLRSHGKCVAYGMSTRSYSVHDSIWLLSILVYSVRGNSKKPYDGILDCTVNIVYRVIYSDGGAVLSSVFSRLVQRSIKGHILTSFLIQFCSLSSKHSCLYAGGLVCKGQSSILSNIIVYTRNGRAFLAYSKWVLCSLKNCCAKNLREVLRVFGW